MSGPDGTVASEYDRVVAQPRLANERTKARLVALLKSAEQTRNLNTTALMGAVDQMLEVADRVGWVVMIEEKDR